MARCGGDSARRHAPRFLIVLVVLTASGCGEITTDAFSKWEKMREQYRERRIRNDDDMRRRMATGAFGREHLLPVSNFKPPASFGRPTKFPLNQTVMRLPSLSEVPVASLATTPVIEIRRGSSATGGGIAGGGASGGACVYKPVMTAEDIAACR
jgi:hypothetical protein